MSGREQIKDMKDRFSAGLRAYVGRGKMFTVEVLSDATGISPSSIYAMQRGDYAPRLCEAALIMEAIGPKFANSIMNPYGMEVRPIDAGDPCPHTANSRIAALMHSLAEKLADGRLDHMEDPQWQREALDLIEWLAGHVNARRNGKGRTS